MQSSAAARTAAWLRHTHQAMPDCMLDSPNAAAGAALHERQASRNMHTISRALVEDAPIMLDLQRRAFAEEGRRSGSGDIPPLAEPLDAVIEHIRTQTALVAREDGRLVGVIRGIVDGRTCIVRALAVDPASRGHGIGSSLLRALERTLPDVTQFDLTTNTVMEGNIPFYEKHGYRVVELARRSERVTLAQMTKTVESCVRCALRPASVDDAPGIARLLALLGHSTTPEAIRDMWPIWSGEGNTALVAEQALRVLVGVATLHRMRVLHRSLPVGRITALVVDEHARGAGLGRALVAACEESLRAAGCGLVEITSNVRFQDAHAFYRHLGYEYTSLRFAKRVCG